ncbi:hypothetical protein Nmel_018567 [Mimus melanotis]
MLGCSSLSSAQLLTPRAPLEQCGDRVGNHILSVGNIPRDSSQLHFPAGLRCELAPGEELVAHHHFGGVPVTDRLSQGIFHVPWSREFLRSGPSCHSLPALLPELPAFFHPSLGSSLCVSVNVKILALLPCPTDPPWLSSCARYDCHTSKPPQIGGFPQADSNAYLHLSKGDGSKSLFTRLPILSSIPRASRPEHLPQREVPRAGPAPGVLKRSGQAGLGPCSSHASPVPWDAWRSCEHPGPAGGWIGCGGQTFPF